MMTKHNDFNFFLICQDSIEIHHIFIFVFFNVFPYNLIYLCMYINFQYSYYLQIFSEWYYNLSVSFILRCVPITDSVLKLIYRISQIDRFFFQFAFSQRTYLIEVIIINIQVFLQFRKFYGKDKFAFLSYRTFFCVRTDVLPRWLNIEQFFLFYESILNMFSMEYFLFKLYSWIRYNILHANEISSCKELISSP